MDAMTPEQERMAEQFATMAEAAGAAALRQLVEHLVAGGETTSAAVRLAGAAFLVGHYGDDVLMELGMPQRTSVGVRQRLTAAVAAAGELSEPTEPLLLGRRGRRAASTPVDSRAG